MNKSCSECGSMNNNDAIFCASCEAKLQGTSQSKKKLKYIIVPIIFIVVISGVAASYFIAQNQPPNYFPLKAGLEWNYQVTGNGASNGVVTDLPSQEINGQQVIPQKSDWYTASNSAQPAETDFNFLYAAKDGVHAYASQNGSQTAPKVYGVDNFLIKFPIQNGATFSDSDRDTDTIKNVSDTVTVPAGTFQNVVDIEYGGTSGTEMWFAPNIGLVMFTVTGSNGSQVVYKLTSFKN